MLDNVMEGTLITCLRFSCRLIGTPCQFHPLLWQMCFKLLGVMPSKVTEMGRLVTKDDAVGTNLGFHSFHLSCEHELQSLQKMFSVSSLLKKIDVAVL